jgi:hypothetical protein
MPNHVLQTALTLLPAGLSAIPIGANKRPAIPSWKDYQDRLPTPEEWIAWGLQALRSRGRPGAGEWERGGN